MSEKLFTSDGRDCGAAVDPRYLLTPAKTFRGGMSRVTQGTDTLFGDTVAIKELDVVPRNKFKKYLDREAEILWKIHHPNVVELREYREDHEGSPYLVMEYLDGGTLDSFINTQRQETPSLSYLINCFRFLIHACNGLEQVHKKNIVHRDLKPTNIMLHNDAKSPRAVLIDWMLACEEGLPKDEPGVIVGTIGWMSPEQVCSEKLTRKTDVFALGAVLHTMLTGEAPYDYHDVSETLLRIAAASFPSVSSRAPSIPKPLADLSEHAMAKNPDERPSIPQLRKSAAQLLDRLVRDAKTTI